MAGGPSVSVLRDIQTLFDVGTIGGLSDRQLVDKFALGRDATAEAAFAVLVTRHGPMVLRVCRNVLSDPNDAQDAFQATFLVLVRRVNAIRKLESVGSWLFGVATRVAARARVEAARRRAVERRGGLRVVNAVDAPADGEEGEAEFGPLVQEEVQRLPEKYRAVVVLCYWQGLTQEQAADQLSCPLGTVRSRLARARELLRRRLTRRGVAPLAGALAVGLEGASASATGLSPVPGALVTATIQAGVRVAAGCALAEASSASVAFLVQRVLRSMVVMKLKIAAACLLFLGIGALGVGLAGPQAGSKRATPPATRASRPDHRKSQPPLQSLESYVVEPPDMLMVEVLEALPGRPISGERLVRPDGKISLGFYGDVYVAGLTVPEVKEKIVLHLRKFISEEALGLGERDENGAERKRPAPKDSDRVFVDVTAYNSKNYYVLGMVVSPGRFVVTGHETILDAICYAGGLTPEADHDRVVLYRVEKGGVLRSLPIAIDQIMMGDDPTTNYQLLPGDRLVVPGRSGTSGRPARITAPLPGERLEVPRRQDRPDDAPQAEPSGATPRPRPADRRYFDRRPDARPDPFRDPSPRPSARTDDREPLRDVERRLGEVERKLDQILEALKSRTP
jgi:RNA polymerase sigma factor (sigma-70 family)